MEGLGHFWDKGGRAFRFRLDERRNAFEQEPERVLKLFLDSAGTLTSRRRHRFSDVTHDVFAAFRINAVRNTVAELVQLNERLPKPRNMPVWKEGLGHSNSVQGLQPFFLEQHFTVRKAMAQQFVYLLFNKEMSFENNEIDVLAVRELGDEPPECLNLAIGYVVVRHWRRGLT